MDALVFFTISYVVNGCHINFDFLLPAAAVFLKYFSQWKDRLLSLW